MFASENFGFLTEHTPVPEMDLPFLRWKVPYLRDTPLVCPRCSSPNTKFCYYNNYSLSQPRYFCKACRRYWTKGGSLRNVPVGGGCRKRRRARANMLGNQGACLTNAQNLGANDEQSSGDVAEIDLAVVFARFLNDNGASRSPPNATTTPDSIQEESGSMVGTYAHMDGGNAGEKIESRTTLSGLEDLLNDEFLRDIMSPESDLPGVETNSSKLELPGLRLDDFLESFPATDADPKFSPDVKNYWCPLTLPRVDISQSPWF